MSYRNVFYYDSRRNLTCVRDSDLGLTYYTYDAGSRMTSVKNPFGEVSYYEYRLDNQVKTRVLGNGCVTYYEYDNIGRTSRVENRQGDGSMISSFDYARDAVGNPVSIEREDGYTVYYEYDARHQLTRETHVDEGDVIYAWEWDYDAAGNREYQVFNGEATYYEYNAANELTVETKGEAITYYQYDRCGNTTAKQELAGTTYYHWDYENLLTQIDLPDGAHNYFAYDADGKRVSKRDSEGFTEFIYQGPNMLALQMERDEAGETQVHYTMGAGLESMRRADDGDIESGDSSFYHYDWLGSTHELTDAEQAVTDTYLYNAWGEVLERMGATENPHTWVGRERYSQLRPASLYLLGFRVYVPGIGRFESRDPLTLALSPYYYAGLGPGSLIDPLGLVEYSAGEGPPSNLPPRANHPRDAWPTADDVVQWHMWLAGALGKAPIWPHASLHMIRYLSNFPQDFVIDYPELLADNPDADALFQLWLIDAVRYARPLPPGHYHIVTKYHGVNPALNDDWKNAVNLYGIWADADICVSGDEVSITFTQHFYDWYDWDDQTVHPGRFHKVGLAHEYLMKGQKTVTEVVPRAR